MIYFMESGPQGPIKIGFTERKADMRILDLQCGNPERLRIVATCKGDRCAERDLHRLFHNEKIRGEWFRRTKLVEDAIVTAQQRGDLAFWVKQNTKPKLVVNYEGWAQSAIESAAAVHGTTAIGQALGTATQNVRNWRKGSHRPEPHHFLNFFFLYPEHFQPLPSNGQEAHPGLDFQILVIERKLKALGAIKARCHAIRAKREAA